MARTQSLPLTLVLAASFGAGLVAQSTGKSRTDALYERRRSLGNEKELTASLSTGDLDGDGDLDIVVANGRHWPGQNRIFLGDGKGAFEQRPLGTERSTSYAAGLADLDQDGDLDIVIANDKKPSRVFWNDGKAGFEAGAQVGRISSTRSVSVADLDGVNGPDLIFANRGRANLICFNDGKGGFGRQVTFGAEQGSTIRTAVADLDGDGDVDIAVVNRGEPNQLFLNDGKGGFGEKRPYGTGKDNSRGIAIADVDGDGHADILNANVGQPDMIWFGDGKGGFPRSTPLGGSEPSYAITTTDVNGDGRRDIVVANGRTANAIWIQRAGGEFAKQTFGLPRGITYDLVAADWTGDGRPEIATANSGRPNVIFAQPAAAKVSLFNGKDLTGWHADIPRADKKPDLPPSFVAERGLLISRGRPQGHLITDASYRDYRLVVEWRWPGKPGNCGILVHASKPRMLYKMFPQSIECQLHRGNAGDFWCIGEDIKVPDMAKRRGPKEKWGVVEGKARRIRNLTDGSEKQPGEWNTMIIECRGRRIDVWVNGDHVNDGFDCTADRGRIAIQAEGAPCEFRKLELTPLGK